MPDLNRFANQQEADLLREGLAADEADLCALRQRTERVRLAFTSAESALREAECVFSTAKAAYEHARALETLLEDEMRRKRGLMHPVRRVPNEIWTMVFAEAVEAARHSIWRSEAKNHVKLAQKMALTLSSVCKRWRAAALSHALLWRWIHITISPSWTEDIIDSAKISILARLANYADRTTFHLDVVVQRGVARKKAFWLLFNTLCRAMIHSRSASLSVHDASRDFQDSYLSQCFDTELPLLESLVLEARNRTDPHAVDDNFNDAQVPSTQYRRFFPKCPKLRSLVLGNFPLKLYGTPQTAAPNLQHIQLWSDEIVSDVDMAHALSMYPGVPTLRIQSCEAPHIDAWLGPPVVQTFAHLRSLAIELSNHMARGFGQLQAFPNLQRMKVGDMDDNSYSPTMCAAVARFLTQSCPNVTRVGLVAIPVDNVLSSACRRLPKLRTLFLGSLTLREDALFADAASAEEFPALRRLYVEECDCADNFTGATLLDFARTRHSKDTDRARDAGDGGLPELRRVGVSWNNETATEEHEENLIKDWDAKFTEAVGPSDWGDSSDEDELEKEYMGWDLWPKWA